jgi:photosystem II stability/assembly factor-like uncharacterized protein
LKRHIYTAALVAIIFAVCGNGQAMVWMPFGPDGGDARALAADPHDSKHLYLGAANGWMFESRDGGVAWKRLARVGKRDDLVLDNIVVDAADSKHIVVGAWVLGSSDGGLFVSHDAGLSWTSNADMAGQSIRSLTAAPSDPKTIVAGTLKGVYRSVDGGTKWQQISEEGSQDLHEVESIAIDPADPKIIYAGTWHLPWKTTDSGAHWSSIKEGVIDDSDVFSIIVDPNKPSVVYASACSGIYKSDNAGGKFKKIQGIPSTARRTRVLMQDPKHPETVYAGTTEGLFRTDDSGANWVRTTGPEVIVNDVYVDPNDSSHVMLATDRGGVLTSHDRGNSFEGTNAGFSARQITSLLAEAQRSSYLYAGVVNDKEFGGVFVSENGGLSWMQQSSGLGGRDVFSLGQASDGTVIAGTGHGFYRLKGAQWTRAGDVSAPVDKVPAGRTPVSNRAGGKSVGKRPIVTAKSVAAKKAAAAKVAANGGPFDGSVYAISQSGDTLYAATSEGLLTSGTAGETWQRNAEVERQELLFVAAAKDLVVTAGLKKLMVSSDAGKSWKSLPMPEGLTQISSVAVDDEGEVWVGGREGVYVSRDGGGAWETLKNLYVRDANGIYFDRGSQRVLVTTGGSATLTFAVHLPDRTVKFWDSGWNLRFVRPVGDHLLGATLFDGVVIQPQMVDSPETATR